MDQVKLSVSRTKVNTKMTRVRMTQQVMTLAREDDANGDTNNYDGEQEADDHDDSESHDPDATPHEGGSDSRDRKTQAATNGNGENRKNQRNGERTFVSYVATHPEDDDDAKDPDGLAHAERMALETKAIALIRAREPFLKTTPTGNKGFDLIETDANDEAERWVEVKAMKGSLEDRPVGLSSVQFEFARQHGDQYWLYVVEYAGDPARARILKIKDPVGRSGTFTFDKGWSSIAQIDLLSSSAAEKA